MVLQLLSWLPPPTTSGGVQFRKIPSAPGHSSLHSALQQFAAVIGLNPASHLPLLTVPAGQL